VSYVIDGDLSVAIQLPDALTGAVFGPDVTRTYVGTREACIAKKDELALDARGVRYDIHSSGASPLWELTINFTGIEATEDPTDPGYNPELPINIIWRLTTEFGDIDYRKLGRYQEVLASLSDTHAQEFNALLESFISGKAIPSPTWIATDPGFTLLNELMVRFMRGKSEVHVHWPVLTRDASFRKEANYRSAIPSFNVLYTSAAIIATYPEIPTAFQDGMPTNGTWKVTRCDWEVESSGQGNESIMWVWDEFHDPEDKLYMTLP